MHVTLRVTKSIPSLRREDLFDRIAHSIGATNQSECPRLAGRAFRIIEFSVQSNHLHLVVEAEDKKAMQSGMTSLATRIARSINSALRRSGRVWDGRYYGRALTVPKDVRNTLVYVLMNHAAHTARARPRGKRAGGNASAVVSAYSNTFGVDPCSSAPYFNGFARETDDEARLMFATRRPSPVHAAQTWLLQIGWRRHGLIKRSGHWLPNFGKASPASASIAR